MQNTGKKDSVSEIKMAVLLTPGKLTRGFDVVELLRIEKINGIPRFETQDVNEAVLQLNYPSIPAAGRSLLMQLGVDGLIAMERSIRQQFNKQKAGVVKDSHLRKAMLRQVQQIFYKLSFHTGIKWYYKKVRPDSKNYVIAPCTFNTAKPTLTFEVVKKGIALQLETYVTLDTARFTLDNLKRNLFLLEVNHQYFVLSYTDTQTLEWLQQNPPSKYSHDAPGFAEHIVTKLEENYTVARNNNFEEKRVETLPVNRLMLSELSGSFLMLTPQWLYDGFLVDGPFAETFETRMQGKSVIIQRHKDAERAFLQLLESLHPKFPAQRNGYYYLPFADAQKKQWFLKAYHQLLGEGIDITGMDMLKHFRYSSFKPQTDVTIQQQSGGKAQLQMRILFGDELVPLNILQKALYAGQKAVLLKDGSLGIFTDEWLNQYAAIIKHGKIDKQDIEVSRFMALTDTNERSVFQPLVNKEWWQKWKQWQEGNVPLYTVPQGINATLRPYQQKGFEWLALLAEAGAGACLADDMGLGKSLQTICFLAMYAAREPDAKHIIICPASLLYNWQQELTKFAPGLQAMVFHGGQRQQEDLQKPGLQVIITSYGTLRADADILLATNYGAAILDESHSIKNPSAQITMLANQVMAGMRITLSGTPVVNNTFDLYAQLDFALPGLLGGKEFFKREYADPIDRYRDEERTLALQKLTAPFILRRTKEQVAPELPAKTEIMRWCNMSERQMHIYNDIKNQVRSNIFTDIENNGLGKSKFAVLQGMMKLRQVCNSTMLLPDDERQAYNESVKTRILLEELENILPNHKALVFSQFTSMLDLLAETLTQKSIPFYHFDGQTPPAKRAEMVKAFQEEGNDTCLFLISLKAGNAGLNLTAADYVFLFDPWWNTAVEQQAIDRTHRIGQTRNVFAYKLVCKGTIEEKIIALQERKKQLAEDLVNADEAFIKNLSEEDVAFLFS